MKQEKVACLIDNDASLALDPHDSYLVQVSRARAASGVMVWWEVSLALDPHDSYLVQVSGRVMSPWSAATRF